MENKQINLQKGLTERQAVLLPRLLCEYTQRDVCKMFNVAISQISRAVNGKVRKFEKLNLDFTEYNKIKRKRGGYSVISLEKKLERADNIKFLTEHAKDLIMLMEFYTVKDLARRYEISEESIHVFVANRIKQSKIDYLSLGYIATAFGVSRIDLMKQLEITPDDIQSLGELRNTNQLNVGFGGKSWKETRLVKRVREKV